MKSLAWILGSLAQAHLIQSDVLAWGQALAQEAHLKAVSAIGSNPSPWTWFYAAILAGADEEVRWRPELQAFMTLGLYHLIVVSGSHVHAIQKMMDWFVRPFPKALRLLAVFLSLVGFALINRLQPACFRAVIAWVLGLAAKPTPARNADIQLVVACACLLLAPQWSRSVSFQLSCAASLGLAIVAGFEIRNPWHKRFQTALTCTVLMLPLLSQFQSCFSWLVLPANTLALPILESGLLPVSLLNVLFPWIRPLTEPLVQAVFGISDAVVTAGGPAMCFDERKMKSWGMLYLASLYGCWRLVLPLWLRRKFKVSQQSPRAS
jgi:ComEC/Rec2-related protein